MTTQNLHPDIIDRMAEFDLTPEEGQNLKASQFNLTDLKFRPFLFKDEGHITGEEMRERAILMKGNLGLADVKNLLDQLNDYPDKRKDLQDKNIILPATLLCGSGVHRLYVACLFFYGDYWRLCFRWLGRDWYGGGRFACSE